MEYTILMMLILATAIPAGTQDRWPWTSATDPQAAKMFEQVVAPAKESPALSHLLSAPFGRVTKKQDVMRFLKSKALDDGGYEVVDQATRREALLQKAKERVEQVSGLKSRNTADTEMLAYHALRLRLRLALAFGKVAISKRMASPQTKSYGVQAMESGIDCVRDAAREAETLEKQVKPKAGEVTSAQLWALHKALLAIWDSAKTRDDMSLIRDVDLREVVGKAFEMKGPGKNN